MQVVVNDLFERCVQRSCANLLDPNFTMPVPPAYLFFTAICPVRQGRSFMIRSAPFMSHPIPMMIPLHRWWEVTLSSPPPCKEKNPTYKPSCIPRHGVFFFLFSKVQSFLAACLSLPLSLSPSTRVRTRLPSALSASVRREHAHTQIITPLHTRHHDTTCLALRAYFPAICVCVCVYTWYMHTRTHACMYTRQPFSLRPMSVCVCVCVYTFIHIYIRITHLPI